MLSFLIGLQVRVTGLLRSEEGQGLVEYGLILALVALVVIGALTLVGEDVKSVLNKVGTELGKV